MAKSVIGALRVNLGLDSAKFERGAKKAESRSAKLQKAFKGLAVGAAAVGAGFAALAKRSATLIDTQAKLGASLGTSTASIQTLQRAGDLAGVSFGEIQQATLQLTKRLSQAAGGAGPAAKALKRLGLSAQELQKVPLDERIEVISDALRDIVPASEQAAVASQLFGDRAGLIFTRINGDTIRQASDELDRFNVKVSEADAAQIQKTNDALSALGLISEGIGNQIAAALAPALERMSEGLQRATQEGTLFSAGIKLVAGNIDIIIKAAGALAALFAGKFVASIVLATAKMALLLGPIGLAVAAAAALAAGAVILADKLGIFQGSAEDAKEPTELLNDALRDFAETKAPAAAKAAIDIANANYQMAASAVDAAKAEIAKARAATAAINAGGNGLVRMRSGEGIDRAKRAAQEAEQAALARLAEAERQLGEATNGRTRAAQAVVTSSEFKIAADEAVTASTNAAKDAQDKLADKLKKTGGAAKTAKPEIEKVDEDLNKLAVTADDVGAGLAGVFTDAIQGTKSLKEGLASLAKQFANQLLQKGFQQLLTTGFGGGGTAAATGIASFLGFATGTPSAPGGMAMVGERGPELVNLPKGSQVFDAGRTRSMMQAPAAAPQVSVTPKIVNVMDPKLVGDYLGTPEGENLIVNVMQRNR